VVGYSVFATTIKYIKKRAICTTSRVCKFGQRRRNFVIAELETFTTRVSNAQNFIYQTYDSYLPAFKSLGFKFRTR
jgi:hypothetical protein